MLTYLFTTTILISLSPFLHAASCNHGSIYICVTNMHRIFGVFFLYYFNCICLSSLFIKHFLEQTRSNIWVKFYTWVRKTKLWRNTRLLLSFSFIFPSFPCFFCVFFFWRHIAELSAHKPTFSGPPTQIMTQIWVSKGQFFPILAWPPGIICMPAFGYMRPFPGIALVKG